MDDRTLRSDISRSPRLNDLEGREWVKSTRSWFVLTPPARTKEELSHPAKFPEELASRFVRFFTRSQDWVLDPFVGIGSTLVACDQLGRNGVGVELSPEFAQSAKERLTHAKTQQYVLIGDSMRLVDLIDAYFSDSRPRFSYVFTSPPYFDMLRKSRGGNDSVLKERAAKGMKQYYGESSLDLGNIESYEEYIESVALVIEQAALLLRDRSYLTLIVQNMLDTDGTLRPIAWDLARRLSKTLQLKQEQVWCQDNKRLGCWGYPTTYVSNVHHHYCLVFRRGV
ncbi:MAG: hypothetical protein HXY34_12945 [Candidatus Thorarchaeota archaeon]|nr:hypothetical protein [Candidatus Thorarchaeota archaeon]